MGTDGTFVEVRGLSKSRRRKGFDDDDTATVVAAAEEEKEAVISFTQPVSLVIDWGRALVGSAKLFRKV